MRLLLLAVGVVMALADTEMFVGCGSTQQVQVGQQGAVGHQWVHEFREEVHGTEPSESDMNDGSCSFDESDIRKVTCPMLAALIRNGDLVPQGSKCLIDREQTRRAFRNVGVPEEIVLGTTNGNFRGDGTTCPTCPALINPFEMNQIEDETGQNTGRNTERVPHEHYRSTGIRDNDDNKPFEAAFKHGETKCLGSSSRWNWDSINCFASVWDRSPSCSGVTSNDVALDQRPKGCNGGCEGLKENPKCLSALHGSIRNLFQVFQGPDWTITRGDWRNLWLESTYPPHFVSLKDDITIARDAFALAGIAGAADIGCSSSYQDARNTFGEEGQVFMWCRGGTVDTFGIRYFRDLTTLPEQFFVELAEIKRLRSLALTSNGLTDLHPAIGNLRQLRWLFLLDNKLTALPDSIGDLEQLIYLALYTNRLTTLPWSIGNLGQLEKLFADRNDFRSLPPSIANLGSLEYMYINSNRQLRCVPPLPEGKGPFHYGGNFRADYWAFQGSTCRGR